MTKVAHPIQLFFRLAFRRRDALAFVFLWFVAAVLTDPEFNRFVTVIYAGITVLFSSYFFPSKSVYVSYGLSARTYVAHMVTKTVCVMTLWTAVWLPIHVFFVIPGRYAPSWIFVAAIACLTQIGYGLSVLLGRNRWRQLAKTDIDLQKQGPRIRKILEFYLPGESRLTQKNLANSVIYVLHLHVTILVGLLIVLMLTGSLLLFTFYPAQYEQAFFSGFIGMVVVYPVVAHLAASQQDTLFTWLQFGKTRKSWAQATVLANLMFPIVATIIFGAGIAWLSGNGLVQQTLTEQQKVIRLMYVAIVIAWLTVPLRYVVTNFSLSQPKSWLTPVLLIAICVVLGVLAGTGIVTGVGQVALAMAIYALWAWYLMRDVRNLQARRKEWEKTWLGVS